MEAKKRLGREIVAQYHDAEAAAAAQAGFESQFSAGQAPEEMPEVVFENETAGITEILRTAFEMTGGEAKRLIGQNAVTVDGEKITDIAATIAVRDGVVVKAGKRRWARLKKA
jgi:tyrosyl-tRNA synthetase